MPFNNMKLRTRAAVLAMAIVILFAACDNPTSSNDSDNPSNLKIGDAYQGGIIAYILKSGDPGYISVSAL